MRHGALWGYGLQTKKPSEQLADVLMGRIAWDDAPASIRSWARFPIYQAAREILDMPEKASRRKALAKIPGQIRPRVEDEVMRIHDMRRK